MPVNTLKELLRLRLGETYFAEQEILQLLDALETETQSRIQRDRLRGRRDETRRHVAAVEKCFELLGTDPPRSSSPVMHGICEERRTFVRETPGPVALESYHIDLLSRIAAYKVAAYQGVLDLAADIGQSDVRSLLERCLREEVAAATWLREQRVAILTEVRPPAPERALARPA